MPKLTKRTIDAIEPQATEFFLWDEGIPGFGLRVMPSGRKSFVGCCQTNANQSPFALPSRGSGLEEATPLCESGGAGQLVGVAVLEVALGRKVVVHRGMH